MLLLPETECMPNFLRHCLSPDFHSYDTVRPLMSRSSPLLSLTLIFAFLIPFWPSLPVLYAVDDASFIFSRDYSPPAPPPPPPHPPPSSCADQFSGAGSFDTLCDITSNVTLSSDYTYVAGRGSVFINSDVHILCDSPGCILAFNISGNFTLSPRAKILTGAFELTARSAVVAEGAAVNVTGRGGEVPEGTSGRPEGIAGGGGGHGGRGAGCYTEEDKRKGRSPVDVWGGDSYAWQTLAVPASFGSKGGSTTKESDYGGGGGGRVSIVVKETAQVNGSIVADGGEGGELGGGGAGGSIYIKAQKMIGNGCVSACGGNGYAGGGGGRAAVDVFSRHEEPKIYVHGGGSYHCPVNAGAAGTFYDAVPLSLVVDNYNFSTDTETLLMEFPNQPLWTNIYVRNHAMASLPLLWSRVQVEGQISLLNKGILSFGLERYPSSEFEILAEELLMSDSEIKVYGALRMTVKIFLMWKSKMFIRAGGEATVMTSLLEGSNMIVLKESSVIHSNANLGVHGQGLLNLSGVGDLIEAQRLVLSLFYCIHVGPGSILRGPSNNSSTDAVTPRLHCDAEDCPAELLRPPEDCNVNSSLSFTLQICRVEDVIVEGLVEGSVVHFHRARTIDVYSSGMISASGLGCTGGIGRGSILSNGVGSGGGHGGSGGPGCYKGICVPGGIIYGSRELPCELGSGSGSADSCASTAGGGIIIMGSLEHPLTSLSVEGSVRSDGESFKGSLEEKQYGSPKVLAIYPGGGSGGTLVMFLRTLALTKNATLSTTGGNGSPNGAGGGGGGRIHFHWFDIPTGDLYQPIASVQGSINTWGGAGGHPGNVGGNGSFTGKDCPRGLYGVFCQECPVGTYKNVTGSDGALCQRCPSNELPHRAIYVTIRGGVAETPCPYRCISERYHLPHCYTSLEELIYTFGGPWLFGLLLVGVLLLLALVLSVARVKLVGVDDLAGTTSRPRASQIDNSFPFLESLNEVLETNRAGESQNHMHRMYFMGPNTFSDPWYLPHSPPEQIQEIVYEGEFNSFVDEINALAAYEWWEGAIHSILLVFAYPLAWSWKQWRRKKKLQRLREFVRSEYDHACLRSCRSRALYEGIKVAATSDLMLAYLDFYLGGDEKRSDLPPRLVQRFPMPIIFGGNGGYMAPFSLQSDNILTTLMSQLVPSTTWYRLIAGLNVHLRLVRRGRLRVTFRPVLKWLESHANPALQLHGLQVDLAWFQASSSGYCHYGLLLYAIEDENESSYPETTNHALPTVARSSSRRFLKENPSGPLFEGLLTQNGKTNVRRRRKFGGIIDWSNLHMLEDKGYLLYTLSLIVQNTKPVGHPDMVGMAISVLLLGDCSLVMLTLLQLYSFSLVDVFLVLFVLPFGILLPFPAGINALFSHGPRRSANLSRVYAMWNVASIVNVVVAFICSSVHSVTQPGKGPSSFQPWNFSKDESERWIFPASLLLCKVLQAQIINWHVANLEIQDRSLYSGDFEVFWQS